MPAPTADRLIALYHLEERHWLALEMLSHLLEALPLTMKRTVAKLAKVIDGPRVDSPTASKLAETAIREAVQRGHAALVESFVEQMRLLREGAA